MPPVSRNEANLGWRSVSRARRAGRCEAANCACVVRELELLLDVELGVVVVVSGWVVRKAREEGVELAVAAFWLMVEEVGDNRDVKDASREAFCASVDRSAWFSLLVSCSWVRSAWIDSGVGAVAGSGTVRVYQLKILVNAP